MITDGYEFAQWMKTLEIVTLWENICDFCFLLFKTLKI